MSDREIGGEPAITKNSSFIRIQSANKIGALLVMYISRIIFTRSEVRETLHIIYINFFFYYS